MLSNIYELVCDLAPLAAEIGSMLKACHSSTVMVDRTSFVGANNCFQIDSYQVFELNRRSYITINIYFFRPILTEDRIQVKFSIFSPVGNDSSLKMRKIYKEIDGVITAHINPALNID